MKSVKVVFNELNFRKPEKNGPKKNDFFKKREKSRKKKKEKSQTI